MYWDVSKYLFELCADARFGDKVINEVAEFIAKTNPGVKGFNRRGLYRMKQFYETYKDDEFVSPLVTQINSNLYEHTMLSGVRYSEKENMYCCKFRQISTQSVDFLRCQEYTQKKNSFVCLFRKE